MKRLMSVLLGLSLAIGVASVSFAAEDGTTKKETKKKNRKSKKTAPPADTKKPA